MKQLLIFLQGITPRPVKTLLRRLGISRAISWVMGKKTTELAFQTAWAKTFKNNKPLVLEYWERLRAFDEIKTLVKCHDDMNVLDVGCGISTVLHFVPGNRYGIDPLAESYKQLYDYPEEITIVEAGGEDLPFDDGFFGLVFCTNVLDHVTDPRRTIDSIVRVLEKDGHFVLAVELFEDKPERDAAHPHSLAKADVLELVQDRFDIVFEKVTPWIGLRKYVDGIRTSEQDEVILVLRKR